METKKANAKAKALLIDITKCVGCQACEQACQQAHGLAVKHYPVLSEASLTVVEERPNGKFVRRMCQHCNDPACVSACPVGDIKKTDAGPVVYVGDKCIGCRYCMVACPFQVPKYEWSKLAPYMKKCDLCPERVAKGQPTACAEACPVGATIFGDREELLKEARKRIDENPAYVKHIYGEEEVGGTSVFYLSDVPFEQMGFTTPPQDQPLPMLTAAALGDMPTVVSIGGSLLAGLYWFSQRRREIALAEGRAQSPEASTEERS